MGVDQRQRRGFTLIELLIVMAMIAVLAALMIAFFPSATTAQREARAAADLQGWLVIAKQRALRDQAPRGVRLLVAPATLAGAATPFPFAVVECQYLEQPEDFTGGTITTGASNDVLIYNPGAAGGDLVNGYYAAPNLLDATQAALWAVQPGDYVEVMGSGLMRRIPLPPQPGIVDPWTFRVEPPLPNPLAATSSYRIVRAPRPVGQETLKLPFDTMIDLNVPGAPAATPTDVAAGAGYVDVMFAPSGEVISRGVATPNLNFWVRSPNQTDPTNVMRGDPTIVSVFVRTGFVGAYPVDMSSGNPYSLVK